MGSHPSLRLALLPVIIVGLSLAAAVAASAESYPTISGEVVVEVQNDWTYNSKNRDNELNDLFTKIEPTLLTQFTRELSLTLHGVVEPVRSPGARDNRAFDDEGLFIEDLFLSYELDPFSVKGGKFTPNFGIAWDAAPGIYGRDMAEDYELSERIGFGGGYNFGNGSGGSHTVSASVFFKDTSVLSESLFANRPRARRADGGASNTEELTSFALALDGRNVPWLKGLNYHVGLLRQAEGVDGNSDELGYVVGLSHSIDLGQGIAFNPVLEYVFFDDAGGIDGTDKSYLTAATEITWKDWNMALAYTWRRTDPAAGADTDDHQFQLSAGYSLPIGINVNVGGKLVEEAGVRSEVIGFLVDYKFDF